MKKPLIVLTGPTAAGKTHLSIALAKAVNGEIISADSMHSHFKVKSSVVIPCRYINIWILALLRFVRKKCRE